MSTHTALPGSHEHSAGGHERRTGAALNGVAFSATLQVEVPSGPPPGDLEVEDIVEGEGDVARPGDLVEVEYVGVLYDTGREFDSSWERDEPFAFELGAGMVIPGWDEGLEGMKAGGRRRLTIPPDLAYGDAGAPPDIGPDETLVFVVDPVDVR